MILQLATQHRRKIAAFFYFLFYASVVVPARATRLLYKVQFEQYSNNRIRFNDHVNADNKPAGHFNASGQNLFIPQTAMDIKGQDKIIKPAHVLIGGPSQPEMASFKSVNTDNMVNLFTGDFSYNIPLLDVNGYPVNIYYDGGVGPEQEASWVGLGWNINPGNINRNNRGVPDDFNGQDTLVQAQKIKPNRTWGLSVGADLELLGSKQAIFNDTTNFSVKAGASLGVSFNNYLGPSLDLGLRGSASYKISGMAGSEKFALSPSANIGIDINSRSGTSFSGGVSLTASTQFKNNSLSFGPGLSTGYNSRSGLKALQIAEQVSFNNYEEKKKINHSYSETLFSNSISFLKPSYTPSIRMPLTNTAWSGRFQLGLGSFGVAADVEAEVYGQKSQVADSDVVQKKPMVGYLYYQNAVNNANYVMDFTRFNDKEVTPNTPVISVPQYSYDVFTIQGEGTGGSIRAYRNDLGYVRDNYTVSKDKNLSIGADIDPPGHWGGNFNQVKTPSTIGEWGVGNKLRNTIQFTKANGTFENVYFRNPGENCVIDPARFSQLGGTNLVRFMLGGSGNSPTVEPRLQSFNAAGTLSPTPIDLFSNNVFLERNKRTQVVNFLTASEATLAGLDKTIKSYDNKNFLDNVTDTLLYESIQRVGGIRKPHHISQINVTESNGKRYIYGVPVYNVIQKDFTFSVAGVYPQVPDKVLATPTLASTNSGLLNDNPTTDGYVQITTTPAYAHSFLLSGILSPDYVDVTGNGITEDDLGDAVKFNYTRIKNGTVTTHRWRTPLSAGDSANFNAGSRSEGKDDKAIISYGERESWYLQSVESKTMIALFYVSNRNDGKGPADENGGINSSDTMLKKLDSIALYSKADLKLNGMAKAKPIKTVHFDYNYQLCQNTPDNPNGTAGNKGKLTLQDIYFTYNGKTRAVKNKYILSYQSIDTTKIDNPSYSYGSSDRWGVYKPSGMNPGGMKNSDYPYGLQNPSNKSLIDQYASTWMLKKIVLPSGGQIEVNYESDDYAYVQNKRAADMMQVVGFGNTSSYTASTDRLYPFSYPSNTENDYVFIQVPNACSNATDVYNLYLDGLKQLSFKIWVQMPKGYEYIPCYASFGSIAGVDYGVETTNSKIIWVKMKRIGNKSPLSITTLEYLRQQLPGQAFKGYDVSGEPALKQVADMLVGMLQSLRDAFTDPVNALRKDSKAMHTDLTKCFVRLNDPDGFKYGGGYRVKSVVLKDNWNRMTGQFTSSYGQNYDYTTSENFNGTVRTISSGVASYEPSIGGEENPFQSVIEIQDYMPLGPTSYGAVEMPVLDAFFPAPSVGYSKVTVTAVKNNTDTTKKSRSGIGKQVTEFYTAKDYPVYYSYTPFDASSVKEFHQASTTNFLNKYAYDYKAQSQGFLVATNDMHGKMKSRSSYAENDSSTRISYTENFYRNTGVNGANDKFSFIGKENSGTMYQGNMGIDIDLMTDTREFAVKGSSNEVQGQVDIFYFGIPIPVPTIWPVSGVSENIYRSVTATKVISYHGVLDSVVVIDKGSQLSTKNLAYDAQTGEVLVSRTNNEFNVPVYNASYPAHWAYSGMGLAYKNIDAVYSGINFVDGKITNSGFDFSVFESGDELYIMDPGTPATCPTTSPATVRLIWAFDKNKNDQPLTNITPDFMFIDQAGKMYNRSAVQFRIIRSGHRNLLDGKTAAVTTLLNPLSTGKLLPDSTTKVINASAIEYKEKWQTDNDIFRRLKLVINPVSCSYEEVEDSTGYLEKNINPYTKGLIGNYRVYRNMVYYDSRKEYDTTANTLISDNGLLKNFKLYWNFNVSDNLIPDTLSTQWVWNSKLTEVNGKGMELETQDALGISTSAQYGYNKTLPVAIANNASFNEMFAEGFEDWGYGESLSNAKYNFRKKHIDFSKTTNSFLENADNTIFKAHSGKYMLGVNGNSTGVLNIPIVNEPQKFQTPTGTANQTSVVGGPYGGDFTTINSGVYFDNPNTTFSQANSSGGVYYTLQPYTPVNSISNNNISYYYFVTTKAYFVIPSNGTYTFNFRSSSAMVPSTYANFPAFSSISVYDSTSNTYYSGTDLGSTSDATSKTKTRSFCLNKGVYIMYLQFYASYNYNCTPGPSSSFCGTGGSNAYLVMDSYSVLDAYTPLSSPLFYKSYSTTTNCTYTTPIAASDSMYHSLFTIAPGKKMLFSAWVKENCGDPVNGIPCKEYTYTHNQVQLKFGGTGSADITLTPSGSIIDGWQRYEGVFTAPPGTANMTLNLVNNNSGTVYFDDIRIHPFNANMKSYIYDPVNLRLIAELDPNNYGSFYEYDAEGTLIRTKVETKEGIKTVTETRSALQKIIQQ